MWEYIICFLLELFICLLIQIILLFETHYNGFTLPWCLFKNHDVYINLHNSSCWWKQHAKSFCSRTNHIYLASHDSKHVNSCKAEGPNHLEFDWDMFRRWTVVRHCNCTRCSESQCKFQPPVSSLPWVCSRRFTDCTWWFVCLELIRKMWMKIDFSTGDMYINGVAVSSGYLCCWRIEHHTWKWQSMVSLYLPQVAWFLWPSLAPSRPGAYSTKRMNQSHPFQSCCSGTPVYREQCASNSDSSCCK